MSSINGLDIARSIPHETCIIFTTAHAQYALEGFNLDAVDYLHKPFAYERFCRAVDKAMRRMNPTSVNPQRHITVKQEYSNVNILLNNILYIEALGNYVKIVKVTGGNVLTRTNMKALMQMLPQETFVRIHRSYIVPLNKINSFTRHNVFINGTDSPLPIGHQYANELSERILHHSHLI